MHRNRGCGEEWHGGIGQLETSRISNGFLPGRGQKESKNSSYSWETQVLYTLALLGTNGDSLLYQAPVMVVDVLRGLGPAGKDVTVDS